MQIKGDMRKHVALVHIRGHLLRYPDVMQCISSGNSSLKSSMWKRLHFDSVTASKVVDVALLFPLTMQAEFLTIRQGQAGITT
jgi:hypothetical protein